MKFLKSLLSSAGLGHLPFWQTIGFGLAAIVVVALSAIRISGITAFGVAGLLLSLLAAYEILMLVAAGREATLVASLPEVAEAIASGVASGEPLLQALETLAQSGPKPLARSFTEFNRRVIQGEPLENVLVWLQVELSNVYADQLVQLLLVSLRSGGRGLVANLSQLAADIRTQATLEGELNAKQGWVAGTAKLGLLAPWLIVAFLNQRPEAHTFYVSSAGFVLLVTGLLVCLTAYSIIAVIARLPKPRRVFIDAN